MGGPLGETNYADRLNGDGPDGLRIRAYACFCARSGDKA